MPRATSNCQSIKASASQSAKPTGLASLVPASQGAGLNSLASTLCKRHSQSGYASGRPPKPPSRQQLAQAPVPPVRQSSGRGPVPHPHLPPDSHGPASFPYFKEGFMTQPFRYPLSHTWCRPSCNAHHCCSHCCKHSSVQCTMWLFAILEPCPCAALLYITKCTLFGSSLEKTISQVECILCLQCICLCG